MAPDICGATIDEAWRGSDPTRFRKCTKEATHIYSVVKEQYTHSDGEKNWADAHCIRKTLPQLKQTMPQPQQNAESSPTKRFKLPEMPCPWGCVTRVATHQLDARIIPEGGWTIDNRHCPYCKRQMRLYISAAGEIGQWERDRSCG